jgi:hypothetical protein
MCLQTCYFIEMKSNGIEVIYMDGKPSFVDTLRTCVENARLGLSCLSNQFVETLKSKDYGNYFENVRAEIEIRENTHLSKLLLEQGIDLKVLKENPALVIGYSKVIEHLQYWCYRTHLISFTNSLILLEYGLFN